MLILELIDAAKVLVRFGAILGIFLGLIVTVWYGYNIVLRLSQPLPVINIYDAILFIISFISIGLSYLIYSRYYIHIDDKPFETAIIIVLLGLFIAIGTWIIGGLIILLGGVIILIDEIA